jgi:2-polyprenyl-3-methyl-5-hydroxy-6-metoxy-1,4-benzoquinol methylase
MLSIKEKNSAFYKDLLHLKEEKALGWGSKESQQIRFKVLLEARGLLPKKHSILDVGCGHGDLSNLCKNYVGIDCREDVIKIAKEKYTNKTFVCGTINNITDSYDWVVASGIFPFKENWENYVEEELRRMFDNCKLGISCNFLSELTNKEKRQDLCYASVSVLSKMIEKLTTKYTIRRDYLVNDVTLYAYKSSF